MPRDALPTTRRLEAKRMRELCYACWAKRSEHTVAIARYRWMGSICIAVEARAGEEAIAWALPVFDIRDCPSFRPSNRWTKGAPLRAKRQTLKRARNAERHAAGPGSADQLSAEEATECKSYSSKPIPRYVREWLTQSKRLRQGRPVWAVRWTDENDGMTVLIQKVL